ncbi:MAG: tetratricopeptide repeat protein [Bryobacterales bacterium]|jgi:tetratricopeptide (TPR) repeat protein|nr:tetratricopeptide repeat protein [Bryobacterales bacterium]
MSSRVEKLQELLRQDPNSTFARYGLAQEYANAGQFEDAVREYDALLAANPGYAAAYYHGGQTLERLGRIDAARDLYQRGIAVTSQSGDAHALSELEAALSLIS